MLPWNTAGPAVPERAPRTWNAARGQQTNTSTRRPYPTYVQTDRKGS